MKEYQLSVTHCYDFDVVHFSCVILTPVFVSVNFWSFSQAKRFVVIVMTLTHFYTKTDFVFFAFFCLFVFYFARVISASQGS